MSRAPTILQRELENPLTETRLACEIKKDQFEILRPIWFPGASYYVLPLAGDAHKKGHGGIGASGYCKKQYRIENFQELARFYGF